MTLLSVELAASSGNGMEDFRTKLEQGLVDPNIYHDKELYQRELTRVFGRSWLFLGHESMIRAPGDYFTSYMGEESVIVVRDKNGGIRAFLNRCRHRGVKLCAFDRGRTKAFTCPYHGWAYSVDGALISVPEPDTFGDNLDISALGLVRVAHVATYAGFIFANLDAGAISLDAFLGDMRFHFDNLFGRLYRCVEMSPIKQRSRSRHNWKIAAENGSDMYHVATTHMGAFHEREAFARHLHPDFRGNALEIIGSSGAPPHSLIVADILDSEAYDREIAGELDGESIDYIENIYRARKARGATAAPTIFAQLFPNFLISDFGAQSIAVAMEIFIPMGVNATESWTYVMTDADAPAALRQRAVQNLMRLHSVTGTIVPDDHENWNRMSAGTRSAVSRSVPLVYRQGFGEKGIVASDGRPGIAYTGTSEVGATHFYGHWHELMTQANGR